MRRSALTTIATTSQPWGWFANTLALGVAIGILASSPGRAQMIGNGPIGQSSHIAGPRSPGTATKPVIAEPDAIPGSKPKQAAAPPTRAPSDLPPTEALFDAINRGDIAAARDALNRGADLNGINILGMTPMELSVDLGRNDISFLLLSMRGEDSGRGSRAVGRDSASRAAGREATARVGRKTAQLAGPRATPGTRSQGTQAQVATRSVPAPKLFANDGGAPVPNAGFLGFDSGHASN